MQFPEALFQQLPYVLAETNLSFLSDRYCGKVRDTYRRGTERILVTTDRLSCFDRVVTTVPFKGQVLNQLAYFWFRATADIIANHVIAVPDPNVLVARECTIVPIEVVVRGYLAGSAWRDYSAGKTISGISLPPGMESGQKLQRPVLTPSTKEARGAHDLPISEQEILSGGLVSQEIWSEIRTAAFALFQRGTEIAERNGLLLVDTKYEFGLLDGKVILADEIHTLDSSRYWVASSYEGRLARGEPPEMLDKEPTRQWLLAQGFKGDGPIPHFSDEHRVAIAQHYISAYQRITGATFEAIPGAALERITRALAS